MQSWREQKRPAFPLDEGYLSVVLRPCHLVILFAAALVARAEDGLEFFERKIRPVLVEQCYDCHNAEKLKGGLALDHRAGWEKGGDTGPAIVPGKPDASLLIKSLRHSDPDLKMPKKAPKLEERVIADFAHWIAIGAPDPREKPQAKSAGKPRSWAETFAERKDWWCFQPVTNPNPPEVPDPAWARHPIDRFIFAKLTEKGLAPAPLADPTTLARRLALALTGLPPDEKTRMLLNAGETSAATAADYLLASPTFGEKWARHWLDLARYAETYGSEHDYLNPHAWRYREYVIAAFNDDLPYDQFVREQIAGDLLPPRWKDGLNHAKLGVAWHRMIESYATPVDVKREEITVIDWQLDALGKSFLALTITCARCHDHKFDPISAADFHALYGVFASARPTLSILDDPAKLTAQDRKLATAKDQLRTALANLWQNGVTANALDNALKRDFPAGKPDKKAAPRSDPLAPLRELAKTSDFPKAWHALRQKESQPRKFEGTEFADLTRSLGKWRVSGPGLPASPSPAGILSLAPGDKLVRAIQPAGFYTDAISERHGGALRSPDFILEKRNVSVLASGSGKARLRLVIENFQNDLLLFSGVNADLDSASPRWVTLHTKEYWLGRRARVELLTRDDKTCVGHTMNEVDWAKSDGRSAFGIQRVVLHDGNPPSSPSPFPPALWNGEPANWTEFTEHLAKIAQASLAAWRANRASDEDANFLNALLEGGALTNNADAESVSGFAKTFRDLESAIPLATRAPGVCDDDSGYDCELFPRGDHTKPGASVPRRFLEVLGGAKLGEKDSGRLALANELTRPGNPLVARVIVNRVWQQLFGRGLVPTPDNFGRMGELPSHPELLDHLATVFTRSEKENGCGWSMKKLIRYIVTSRTWQLASAPPARADEIDPANAFLSHANVRRLEAEAIRDSLLAAAGNLKTGYDAGPGVRLFYRTQIDPDKQPPSGPVDGDGRRSIYLAARRLFPSDFLAVFDAPKPNILVGRRSETNVPAQSLTLLNDPFVQNQAKTMAKRITQISGDEARVLKLYELAFSRAPTSAETQNALAFIREAGSDPWRELAHAMFNMKEFIYVR